MASEESKMKSAMIAVDPASIQSAAFKRFSRIIRLYQEKGFFSSVLLTSIIYPAMYVVPREWYQKMKGKFVRDVLTILEKDARGILPFDETKVLQSSNSDHYEDLVEQLCLAGHRERRDILILGSNDRSGLPYWFLGSFSETAALTADLPVLIVKTQAALPDFAKKVRFVVGVDATLPPDRKSLEWLGDLAKSVQAQISLVYVQPRPRFFLDRLDKPRDHSSQHDVIRGSVAILENMGIDVESKVLNEEASKAHAIIEFADKKKAWLIAVLPVKRSGLRQLYMGSTARQLVALSKRPVLSLRFPRKVQ